MINRPFKRYKIIISSHNLESIKSIKFKLKNISCENKHVFLPRKKKVFVLHKSPHVNSKSKEHFKIETFRRIIFLSVNPKTLRRFLSKLPNDLNVKIVLSGYDKF